MNNWKKSLFSLSDKVAMITGASQGIGQVIAQVLSEAGAHVVCLARTEENIKSLADKINGRGGSASHLPCDIRNGDVFTDSINTTEKKHGKHEI